MKVLLVAGPRNEEKINKLLEIKRTHPGDWPEIWTEYAYTQEEEWYNALYYACGEHKDIMLADQAEYLHYYLLNEETEYYAARMCSSEYDAPPSNSNLLDVIELQQGVNNARII